MIKCNLLKLICLFLIFSKSAFGQDFKFGLVGGFDVANSRLTKKQVTGGDTRVFHPIFSFNTNAYVGYKSASFWGISLEPGYIQKGGELKYENDYYDVRVQMNYIQLPILADFYLGEKFSISVGPEFSYMINAKAKSTDFSNDISGFYNKKFELSGIVGINYYFHKNFDIGLKYNHGLTYTTKIEWTDDNGILIGQTNEYNQYFQLCVRFKK